MRLDGNTHLMENLLQVEPRVANYVPVLGDTAWEQKPSAATPATSSVVSRTDKALSGITRKLKSTRKSRAVPYAQKLLRFQNRAKLLTAEGQHLPGEIVAFGVDETTKGRHLLFIVKCHKCGKEKDMRSDNYWGQNHTCGCGAEQNRADQIEKVIAVIGRDDDDIAKALELGQLPNKGYRGTFKATRTEICDHFCYERVEIPALTSVVGYGFNLDVAQFGEFSASLNQRIPGQSATWELSA
jgi:hypothetical protein